MSYRKSGQTTPRKTKAKSSAFYIRELLEMRETTTEQLDYALETGDDVQRVSCERELAIIDSAIVTHRANQARQDAQRAEVTR